MADELTIDIRIDWEGASIEPGQVRLSRNIDVSAGIWFYQKIDVDADFTLPGNVLPGYNKSDDYAAGGYCIVRHTGELGTTTYKPCYIIATSADDPTIKLLPGEVAIFRHSATTSALSIGRDTSDPGLDPQIEIWYFEP